MEPQRTADAHQLPGAPGSSLGSEVRSNLTILLKMDSMSALTHQQRGGTISPKLNLLAKEL